MMTDRRASADEQLHDCIESVHSALVKREVLSPPGWRARVEAVVHAGRAVLRAEWARIKRGD